MKQIYSLISCAAAIENLIAIANSVRSKPRASELELLSEQARQVVAMLHDERTQAALDDATLRMRGRGA